MKSLSAPLSATLTALSLVITMTPTPAISQVARQLIGHTVQFGIGQLLVIY